MDKSNRTAVFSQETVPKHNDVVYYQVCLAGKGSLTYSRLVNLIDVTLACEDDNSKLVEVVTVANVDDEKRVDNSLMQIWKLRFWRQDRFLRMGFGQDF